MTPDLKTLESLLERVKGATEGSRGLDYALYSNLMLPDGGDINLFAVPHFTASVDAAIGLVERVFPGVLYVLGKGSEPLFACQFYLAEDPDNVITDAEHDGSLCLAVCAAILTALIAQAKEGGE